MMKQKRGSRTQPYTPGRRANINIGAFLGGGAGGASEVNPAFDAANPEATIGQGASEGGGNLAGEQFAQRQQPFVTTQQPSWYARTFQGARDPSDERNAQFWGNRFAQQSNLGLEQAQKERNAPRVVNGPEGYTPVFGDTLEGLKMDAERASQMAQEKATNDAAIEKEKNLMLNRISIQDPADINKARAMSYSAKGLDMSKIPVDEISATTGRNMLGQEKTEEALQNDPRFKPTYIQSKLDTMKLPGSFTLGNGDVRVTPDANYFGQSILKGQEQNMFPNKKTGIMEPVPGSYRDTYSMSPFRKEPIVRVPLESMNPNPPAAKNPDPAEFGTTNFPPVSKQRLNSDNSAMDNFLQLFQLIKKAQQAQ